jgi:hypothetical protein
MGVGRSHNRENHICIEKKIFSSWSISLKLGTNHPWVKTIKTCLNEGPGPCPREDNHKNAKIG